MSDETQVKNNPVIGSRLLKSGALNAVTRAEEAVTQAEARAAEIIKNAEAQAAEIIQNAEREGKRQAAALMVRYAGIIESDFAAMESRVADLALKATRLMLEPFDDAELAARAANRALQEVDAARPVTLTVATPLLEDVKAYLQRIRAPERITAVGDPNQPADSALLSTPYGDIDLGIETQMRVIKAALTQGGEQGAGEPAA